MHDEREWLPVTSPWDDEDDESVEWVPVEPVLIDDDEDEPIEWDSRGWEDAPLFGDPPIRRTPFYPAPYTQTAPSPPRREGERRPRAKAKPQKDPDQLTKRRRKKLRAWDIEDEG